MDPDPDTPELVVRLPKARRLQFGVRDVIVIIACLGLFLWAMRTLWESQHPVVGVARGLVAGTAAQRVLAIRELEALGVDDSVIAMRPLIARLEDADATVRAAAADALGSLGSSAIKAGTGKSEVHAAMSGLLGSLNDQQPSVRKAAANALRGIVSCDASQTIELNPAAEVLVGLIDDPSTDVRGSVIAALGFIGPPILVDPPPAMVAALEDESVNVRVQAVASLARYTRGLPRLIPALLRSFHMARPEARLSYRALIDMIKPPSFSDEVIRPFASAVGDDDPEVCCLAITQLATFGPRARDAIPLLIQTLTEPMEVNNSTRRKQTGDPSAHEPSWAAAIALRKIAPGTDRAAVTAAALSEVIRSGQPHLRGVSIETLTHFGPEAEAAIPTLIEEFRASIRAKENEGTIEPTAEPFPRSWQIDSIARALHAIAAGTPSADKVVEVMIEILQSQSGFGRLAAAGALSRFGPEAARAIPLLRPLQNDPDPDVRSVAAEALKDLAPREDGTTGAHVRSRR